MRVFILVFLLGCAAYALEVSKQIPQVTLSKGSGGIVDGKSWSSDTLRDKVHVVFYVDPDEKDLNSDFNDALKKQKFDRENYATVAIINLAATWLPNFAISASLQEKQKKFPDTTYVKDLDKSVLKAWRVKDDSSNIIVVDKSGTVIYYHGGKIPQSEFEKIFKIIKESL